MLPLGALQNVNEGRNKDDMEVKEFGVKQLPEAEKKLEEEKKETLTTEKQPTVQPKKAFKEKDKEAEKKLEEEIRCAMCQKLHNCSK